MTDIIESTTFSRHVCAYLAHWRALGRRYRQEEWLLGALMRDLATFGHDDLTAQSYALWFEAKKDRHPNTRRKWAQLLRHFCLFRRRLSPDCFVPGPEQACNRRPYVTPVILGDDDVANLLRVADRLTPAPGSPLRAAMMRIAIVLLYTTGIRIGELQRLTLGDIEDDGALLRIRESKFQKTRFVPLSQSAQEELADFLHRRATKGFSIATSSGLLMPRPGRSIGYSIPGLQAAIKALFNAASIADRNGRRPASTTCGTASLYRCSRGLIGMARMCRYFCPSSPCTWGTSRSNPRPIICNGAKNWACWRASGSPPASPT